MWQTITQGGVVMVPLAACSILALWVVIDRAWNLRHDRVVRSEIVDVIDTLEGPGDLPLARSICERNPGAFSTIVLTAIDHRGESREAMREAVEEQGRQEVARLERGLGLLETIAGVAPLLGLLGTVLGMIDVFEIVSRQGAGQAQSLSGGIAEALITTATGLSIGIPSLVAYNWLVGRAERLVLDIEAHTSRLMKKIHGFRAADEAR